jgi:hypothetical protein
MSGDPTFSDLALNSKDAAHPNPLFDFLTGFVPRKLKDLFKWAEYLVFNSAQVYAVVKKFGEFPITKIVYESAVPGVLAVHRKIFEKNLGVLSFLTKASFDKFIYGNGFYSIYTPFKRFLECKSCKSRKDINYIDYKFKVKSLEFTYTCTNCKKLTKGRMVDLKLKDASKLRMIRWDPKLIDIEHNPITDESVYYYTIPKSMKEQIDKGNKVLINSMPKGFLEAVKENKIFRFEKDALYHMKVPGPAGVEAHWGFPPITSSIKLFLFAAILRKANEAIALEHIVPFRVLFPQMNSPNGDPLTTISLAKWRTELEHNLKRWRRDPLAIQFAPVPLGVTNLGGEGRALMVSAEIKDAESNIVTAMGVPMEFITGGLGQTRGEISLRMLENQLRCHTEDLNKLLQWIEDKVARYMGFEPVPVHLSDFKMIDDSEKKQLVMQLWAQGKVSDSTIAEMFELDLDKERDLILENAIAQAKAQQKTEAEMKKIQGSLVQQVQQQASATGLDYNDPQQVIAAADQKVQEFMALDPNTRRSQLDGLKTEDIIMFSVVKERMEQAQQTQEAEVKQQVRQGQGQ